MPTLPPAYEHVESHPANDGDLLDLIDEWIAVASTQKTLLVDNPAKLYTGSATP